MKLVTMDAVIGAIIGLLDNFIRDVKNQKAEFTDTQKMLVASAFVFLDNCANNKNRILPTGIVMDDKEASRIVNALLKISAVDLITKTENKELSREEIIAHMNQIIAPEEIDMENIEEHKIYNKRYKNAVDFLDKNFGIVIINAKRNRKTGVITDVDYERYEK